MNAFIPIWARRLKSERHERCWSQKDMVRRLVEVASEHANIRLPSRESLARMLREWESGRTHPRLPYPRLLALAFGLTEAELFGQPDISENGSGEPRERTLELKASTQDEDDEMKRRRLMKDAAVVAVGGAIAPTLTTLTDAWQASQSCLSGASVSRGMIDDWEEAADVHAKAARVEPPAAVLAALAADCAEMAPHLACQQPRSVRRDLTRAAARHAALIAGKWTDMGNRRQARRWWGTTRALADESGDRLLASWLRRREALHRADDPAEDLAEVLSIAQEARRLAGQQPNPPLVAAIAEEAMIFAVMGRHGEAVTALRAADDVFARLPSTEGRFRSVERELCFGRSLVYSLAGHEKRAEEAQDSAEKLYSPGDQSLPRIRLHRAALYARTAPAEAADEAFKVVSGIPPKRWLVRYMADIEHVIKALPETARSLPAVRELRALASEGRSA